MRVQTEYGKVGVFRYEKDSTSQLEKVWYKCLNKYNWFEVSNITQMICHIKMIL